MTDESTKKTEQVMIRLTLNDLAALRAAAEADDRTIAATVRLAIRRYLRDTR